MMKTILYRIMVIIVLIIIIINVFSIFHFSFIGFRLFRVGSGSMQPYLKVNDYILVKKSENYEVDDVITYQIKDNEYVTHRILRVNEDTFITKGDANNIEDDPINKENVVGKVVLKLGVFSFILYLFSQPFSWIILFVVGFVITLFIPNKKDE